MYICERYTMRAVQWIRTVMANAKSEEIMCQFSFNWAPVRLGGQFQSGRAGEDEADHWQVREGRKFPQVRLGSCTNLKQHT